MPSILIVEDDPTTARDIARELEAQGYVTRCVSNGAEAIALARQPGFDAITLDRLLPDADGLGIVSQLRREGVRTPVLMLSALSDVDERIAGLRAGGDDYLVKPFVPSEMVVRVEALLRRANPDGETMLRSGGVVVDLLRREVSVNDRPVRLLPMEFRLLEFLVRHAGQVVSRRVLFEKVWNYHFDPGPNLIQVHIARLRRKLDPPGAQSVIATVKGEGYRFDAR